MAHKNGAPTGRDGRGRFTSENPGRPKGARNRATVAAERLLEGEAETLARRCIDLALTGDVTALRLALERVVPPRRERAVRLTLPRVARAADLPAALGALLEAVARGDVTPGEAQRVAAVLGEQTRALELVELEQRIAALEAAGGD